MAFFKFRKNRDERSSSAVQPESVEVMRRRAKHRLIGAAVLVLVGVIGFPLLFDKQQRPIAVDTPIEIPDKNKVKPFNIPASAALKSEMAAAVTPTVAASKEPSVTALVSSEPAQGLAEAVAKPLGKVDEGAKVKALLEGRDAQEKTLAEDRFVVQVGAFADASRAREVRLKVERVGLKTYTQVAETKDGSRIRVRVGPFDSKAEADKAAEKIKRLELPAAILSL